VGRKRREGPSKLGLFKQYFIDHPEWLNARSNDAVLAQFAADHPEITVTPQIKQAMFNAKNYVRRGPKGKRRRRKAAAHMQAAMARPGRKSAVLQMLEGRIDDCLVMARQLGRDDMGAVIAHLRSARNSLIIKIES
jgi:hypothetical protein